MRNASNAANDSKCNLVRTHKFIANLSQISRFRIPGTAKKGLIDQENICTVDVSVVFAVYDQPLRGNRELLTGNRGREETEQGEMEQGSYVYLKTI